MRENSPIFAYQRLVAVVRRIGSRSKTICLTIAGTPHFLSLLRFPLGASFAVVIQDTRHFDGLVAIGLVQDDTVTAFRARCNMMELNIMSKKSTAHDELRRFRPGVSLHGEHFRHAEPLLVDPEGIRVGYQMNEKKNSSRRQETASDPGVVRSLEPEMETDNRHDTACHG